MRSEKEKMLGGELYDPLDPRPSAERRSARLLFKALNDTRDDQQEERARLIRELIPDAGEGVFASGNPAASYAKTESKVRASRRVTR